ncbi:glycerol-3-phosphate acyltransferase [Hoeflea sp. IMCC20628]|uniref:1-acyl-sn-glycerol-3-phosphate acyltransferase n=1 Tax=Hoeflea sp. IMCC20628 TaxID=1620421 RepID=UPI00063A8D7D|nr:1-acyl-sn-glycerol-3-phosphate acyltransferase [Hoeflea sp. IMCC20628]AKI00970.1 glycerol-3-phosphate acyltransferase [Hoeflea sp. IMCC20628]
MSQTIEVPFWVIIIASVLAAIAITDRLLSPAVRWFFRRRVNQAIEELNTRLQLKIRSFGTTRREVLIDRVSNDPHVVEAVAALSRETGTPIQVVIARASRYAREIVPMFNAYAYFRIGTRLARWLATALYRVRLGYTNTDALAKVAPDSSVVFVMNHRSNMDYVLVTYLASSSTALSYAVGEWARLPVLQTLIRFMGAYFIRRNARNPLYRKVLATYVRMATEAGVTQAVFPEGGLSRDGLLRPPRIGLISYIVSAHDHVAHDTVFIPVGLNYDRVLEDRSLVFEADRDGPPLSSWQKTAKTSAFLFRNLRLRLSGKWHRFGYASVSFGDPVSVDTFLAAHGISKWSALTEAKRDRLTETLAHQLMQSIGALIPVLPVSLVSLALIDAAAAPVDRLELKIRIGALIDRLVGNGVHVHVPRQDRDYEITVGLRMLLLRRIVSETEDGQLVINARDKPLVAYYANAIRHLL